MRYLIPLILAIPAFAAEHGGEHAEPSIWWKWANFAILCAVLGYIINKHAGAFFRSRTADIQSGLTEAAKMRENAERQVADIERRVANLETEISTLKATAKKEMSVEADRLRVETAKALERIQAQAQFEIASATKVASAELKKRTAELAVELASGEIRQRMSGATQDKLVTAFVSQLGTARK